MATFDFDATAVEPQQDFQALPAGEYLVHVKDSEMKQTKAGTGEYLQLTFEVLEGQAKGRLIFDRMNLRNLNQVAVQIGQQHLSSLCRAIGVMHVKDSSDLHNKPVIIRLSVKRGDGNYEDSNDVKAFKPAKGSAPVATPAPQATGTNGATAPWQ